MKFGIFGPSKLVSSATSTPTTPTTPIVLRVCLCVTVVLPLLTVALMLAVCLLVIAVACAVRYAHKYCCCLAARVGSYTPAPSATRRPHGYTTPNHRQVRGVERAQEHTEKQWTTGTRTEQLAATGPTYRSIVIIGSDRLARRVAPTKDTAKPYWIVRQKTGNSWGNFSQVTNETLPLPPPPPAPLPSQIIVLGRAEDDDDMRKRTVPAMANLLEGRLEARAETQPASN